MQLGRFKFRPSASRARVIAHAPGHRFRVEGAGIEGVIELAEDRLLTASASFPLAALDAGDPLGNHELRKFLGLREHPIARGTIASPVLLRAAGPPKSRAGEGSVVLSIARREMVTTIRLEGEPPRVAAKFTLTFSGLGYPPPKLLFLKVKDTIDVEIEAELEPILEDRRP